MNENLKNIKLKRKVIELRHSDDQKSIERNAFFDQELEYCGSSCLLIIFTK